jgi:hypothetical protein
MTEELERMDAEYHELHVEQIREAIEGRVLPEAFPVNDHGRVCVARTFPDL